MDLSDLIAPEAVLAHASAGNSREALKLAARLMGRRLWTPIRLVEDALLAREALGSTGFGGGVALPHGRLPGLDRHVAGVVRLSQPVDFNSFDGKPVWLLIVLLGPEAAGAGHLKALARISRAIRTPGMRERIAGAADAAAIHALLAGREPGEAAPAREVA